MKKGIKEKKIQKLMNLAIILVISLVCLTSKVNAECTYNLVEESTKFTLSSGTSTGNSNTYYSSSATYFSGYETIFSIDSNSTECHGIYPGQYLMEFYVYSESDFNSALTISNFSSNFKNINVTTGNLVVNEIASQLVDFYQTTYNGKNAYRLLYKFTFDGDYANEFDFIIKTSTNYFFNNSSGIGGYGVAYSNIQDYNISIIDSFNSDKLKQKEIDELGNIDDSINDNFNSCRDSYNLFNKASSSYGYIATNSTDENLASSTSAITSNWISAEPNTYYTISGGNRRRIQLKNSDGTITYSDYSSDTSSNITFKTDSDTVYFRVFLYTLAATGTSDNIQIQEGQNATAYEPYGTEICQNKFDEQLQQDKEQHDEFMNSDISDEDKELPDDSKYQDYTDTENSLKDKVNEADMSVISIGIDPNSSNWVWETLTSLIQSHSVIFGMFISILSIGIIKLALGR